MSLKGSTAMDFSEIRGGAGAVADANAATGASLMTCFGTQGLSMTRYPNTTANKTATAEITHRLRRGASE
jgi:hypothetical protein